MTSSEAEGVVVYSKPACMQCEMTKKTLTEKGIKHEVVDITQNPKAYKRVTDMGYKTVPVVEAGRESWAGFQPDRIGALKR